MKPSAFLLVVAGVLGVVGTLMPWFEPQYGGVVVGLSLHAWQNPFGLVAFGVAAIALALGVLLFAEASGHTIHALPDIDSLVSRARYLPVLGVAALVYVWVKLPDQVTITGGCAGLDCPLYWIDGPGASRGTQLGFWLVVVANVLIVPVALVVSRRRRLAVDAALEEYVDPLEAKRT